MSMTVDEAVMRLDLLQALDRFDASNEPQTAAELLATGLDYWNNGQIENDTFSSIVGTVIDYLIALGKVLADIQNRNGEAK